MEAEAEGEEAEEEEEEEEELDANETAKPFFTGCDAIGNYFLAPANGSLIVVHVPYSEYDPVQTGEVEQVAPSLRWGEDEPPAKEVDDVGSPVVVVLIAGFGLQVVAIVSWCCYRQRYRCKRLWRRRVTVVGDDGDQSYISKGI